MNVIGTEQSDEDKKKQWQATLILVISPLTKIE